MCGRFTLKSPDRLKFDRIDRSTLPPLFARYNIAPSQNVLTILERDSEREATFLRWGLIPFWSKEPKGFINARAETVGQKAAFGESFQRRRCLIPADGFYEWERNGKISQPYYFQMKDQAAFAFAGPRAGSTTVLPAPGALCTVRLTTAENHAGSYCVMLF